MTATLRESDEDVALRRTVADIAERCRSSRSAEGDDHTSCWGALVRSGLTELRGADDDGAPLATVGQVVIVVEEMARAVCGAPLVGTLLAAELQRLAGVDDVVADEALTVLLDRRPRAAWRPPTPSRGTPPRLSPGPWDSTASASWCGRSTPATPSQDLSRPVAVPAGDAEPVGAHARRRGPRTAFEAFAHVVLAADLLGAVGCGARGGDRVRRSARAVRAADRHVPGRPAPVRPRARAGRGSAQRPAVRGVVARLRPERRRPAIVAKAYGASAAVEVVENAVQVFGGVAITWEFPAHRHLRRVLLDAEVLGNGSALSGHLFDVVEGRSDGLQ